ncbi:Lachesin [Portunus trituberculatus]|uniref:Lachesin n=1 Tax=Portunus trituberculatus TaxID=210409 RepID=A0A5B7JQE5_PORTR|nr:Lachesin [Portunus trituberculatus]
MGAYLCIARNSVPPQVSKRVLLHVHFHPIIHVPNQLIGSPYGKDVTLECKVEASPKPVTFWQNSQGRVVVVVVVVVVIVVVVIVVVVVVVAVVVVVMVEITNKLMIINK